MKNLRHRALRTTTISSLAILALSFAPSLGAQVTVTVDITGDPVPGGMVSATATVDITDGSTVLGYAWSQAGGVPAALNGAGSQSVQATLGPVASYKDHLFEILMEPPIGPDQLPPNVQLPDGEFPGGLQNRFELVGLNPFALEETGLVTLQVDVTTTSGTYQGAGEIHTSIPWKPAAGIRNVPIGIPVLLHGKDQDSYDWTLLPPVGSLASLRDASTQYPELTPDVNGLYTLTVTDRATDENAPTLRMIEIYAGAWRGSIVGEDAIDGRPVPDPECTSCHTDLAPDEFTPWRETGHAEIFTQNINSSAFWGPQCFQCHTVGFDPDVDNGGIDEAPDFQAFLASGLIGSPAPDNWTQVTNQFPETAQLANAQCENCHGPQNKLNDNMAHGIFDPEGEPRASLSANVCATCHGEPLRHARFQQWQLSSHADYELATERSESGSCARCHTANGFLKWLPVLLDDDPSTDPLANVVVDWEPDEVHPQTCVTCHDPHRTGTTSGSDTNAQVRIAGDTPPLIAGFVATDVGRGALCMTCHNSRRGLRNDSTFSSFLGTAEASRAPHGSAQADMLMGENAYLVAVGSRGNHADPIEVPDACVNCHMEQTPPPALLSYNQGGTNHTFFAGDAICQDCHPDGRTASLIQGVVKANLDDLEGRIEDKLLDLISEQIGSGNTIDLGGQATITNPGDIAEIQLGESRGRQAITVTFGDASVVGPTGMNSVHVVPPAGTPFDLYDVASPGLIKSGWNWALVTNDGSLGVHNPSFASRVINASRDALTRGPALCEDSGTEVCLNRDRFRVSVDFRRPPAFPNTGPAMVSNLQTDDSANFWFLEASNLEFLIKVINGCDLNDRYWVFFAGTTDVEFTVNVTDTRTGQRKSYFNPLGHPADAVTDTQAFATCP